MTLRLINSKTHKFEGFVGPRGIPPYAILSHTWIQDSEVTYEEFRNLGQKSNERQNRIKSRSGYKKIKRACHEALRDGIDWVWVDTCCIDKRSSEEVAVSINSMFTWYKKARVCYAYLEDIVAKKSDDEKDLSLANARRLRESRWFKRGWTLQELIAPKKVEFFDMDWKFVGTRKTLKRPLATITNIDEHVLAGAGMGRVCVARRMTWAAGRRTTRLEDTAYSLLGIFGVSMPIIYGEGKVKAFKRLQEEIVERNGDQTIFAWQPVKSVKVSVQHPPISMDVGEGLDYFASSPKQFVFPRARRIYPITRQGTPPPTISGGKHINIRVKPMPHHEGLFLGILACASKDHPDKSIAIVLERRQDGYARHNTAALYFYRPTEPRRSESSSPDSFIST